LFDPLGIARRPAEDGAAESRHLTELDTLNRPMWTYTAPTDSNRWSRRDTLVKITGLAR
jgi:hypothetical protein